MTWIQVTRIHEQTMDEQRWEQKHWLNAHHIMAIAEPTPYMATRSGAQAEIAMVTDGLVFYVKESPEDLLVKLLG